MCSSDNEGLRITDHEDSEVIDSEAEDTEIHLLPHDCLLVPCRTTYKYLPTNFNTMTV